VPGVHGVSAVAAVAAVHGVAAVPVLWLKQATRQTMQHGSRPLQPIGRPPPYPPPQCISLLAARTAHNKSNPGTQFIAALARKKEMGEKEQKYAWRAEWKSKRWNKRIALRYGEWQRRCQAVLLRVQETALVPSPAEGPYTASTAAFLPPQLQPLFDEEQDICQDLTSTGDPEWLLAVLFQATNAPAASMLTNSW